RTSSPGIGRRRPRRMLERVDAPVGASAKPAARAAAGRVCAFRGSDGTPNRRSPLPDDESRAAPLFGAGYARSNAVPGDGSDGRDAEGPNGAAGSRRRPDLSLHLQSGLLPDRPSGGV